MLADTPVIAESADRLLLSTHGLCVHADGRHILDHIDLGLHEGEIVTVIGPNGAGKTTLLKALLGFITPNAGTVTRSNNLRIGYMPQKLVLNPLLPITVQRFLRQTNTSDAAIVDALTQTGVADLLQQSLHKISGGELQRVLLARALLRQPQLLVLDEPAQGVDVCGQADLYRLIAELRNRYHCGVLLVSHDLHLVMAATDTVICLNQHICCQGHPEHVSQHPEYLQLFGGKIADGIAVYTHHHDHDHDLHGNVHKGCVHD
ncbi:MAG TPA: zinc ABC transporter ATP-binding protein ZnuC [Pseudomonadales bacterium]|nr:zinc ABC transporter ATP-binding protein ZnuC [Pseudomonadales bacterium]